MTFVACGGDNGAKIPADLVGTWRHSGIAVMTINANGSGNWGGQMAVTWSNSGNILTMSASGQNMGTVTWQITGGKLNLSGTTAAIVGLNGMPDLEKM